MLNEREEKRLEACLAIIEIGDIHSLELETQLWLATKLKESNDALKKWETAHVEHRTPEKTHPTTVSIKTDKNVHIVATWNKELNAYECLFCDVYNQSSEDMASHGMKHIKAG